VKMNGKESSILLAQSRHPHVGMSARKAVGSVRDPRSERPSEERGRNGGEPGRATSPLGTIFWEELLAAALRRIVQCGALVVRFPSGRHRRFGEKYGAAIDVTIADSGALRRIAVSPELALGEAYVDGFLTIAQDDVDGLLSLLVQNLMRIRSRLGASAALGAAKRGGHAANGEDRARRNVAHHYDLSNDFYALFLDADLQYSCAYFEAESDTLEAAQEAKKQLIARKLCLRPGHSVLDIGCGWGGLGLHLAERHGVRVRGITLSQAQHVAAQGRAEALTPTPIAVFALEDYRKTRGQFDRIVSVGMFEHVGRRHYDEYFRTIADLLVEDGLALIHTIGRKSGPGATNPWVARHVFPGGYAPALSEILPAIERAGLYVTDIEVWRSHYARTLSAWRERFETQIAQVRVMFDERFCRLWRFYLAVSEVAFRDGDHVVFQIQVARRQETAPVTRDYLHAACDQSG
jgi:cyclopropane-fatty-acyl-phospholipid synthase